MFTWVYEGGWMRYRGRGGWVGGWVGRTTRTSQLSFSSPDLAGGWSWSLMRSRHMTPTRSPLVGGWVGGWVGWMSCCCCGHGWVGGWVGG